MHKYLVEFLGTTFIAFVIFGTGNFLAISAAFSIAILLGGSYSIAAYNPAITIALMYYGRLPRADLIPYIVAQVAGAITGLELVKFVVNKPV